MSSVVTLAAKIIGALQTSYGGALHLTLMSVSPSYAIHMVPLLSISRVAVSAPASMNILAFVARFDHILYVWVAGSYWAEARLALALSPRKSSMCTTSPTTLTSHLE